MNDCSSSFIHSCLRTLRSKLSISLLLLAIFIVLSFTIANGQEIRLKSVIGSGALDGIYVGPVVFRFEYVFGPTETHSVSNGFRVHSPDGALWGGASISAATATANLSEFDGNVSTTVLSGDGQLADTVTISGSDLIPPGIPAGAIRTVVEMMISPTLSSGGKHICIDSCWFPPSNDWVWTDVGGALAVEWGGAHLPPCTAMGRIRAIVFRLFWSRLPGR